MENDLTPRRDALAARARLRYGLFLKGFILEPGLSQTCVQICYMGWNIFVWPCVSL